MERNDFAVDTAHAGDVEYNRTVHFTSVVTLPLVRREITIYVGTTVFQDTRLDHGYLALLAGRIAAALNEDPA